jgi:putative hydrolase of the HAD superfamily
MDNFHPAKIKVIGFDADDTLWVNEPYYRETEDKFSELLQEYAPAEEINHRLYAVEMANMELYGYGTKAFMLSLIETAIKVSDGRISASNIARIIELGKAQIALKNSLLPGVTEVLGKLTAKYRLIVAIKGDLLDQERKLKNSGIAGFFHHIEIMTDKKKENYRKLLNHLDIAAHEFLMIGNSVKSDVLPVVNLGGYAIHVPFHITWEHEKVAENEIPNGRFISVDSILEVLAILGLKD